MTATCSFDGCTVYETGICALERDPSTCVNRVANKAPSSTPSDSHGDDGASPLTGDKLGSPVLSQPVSAGVFPSSRTLGIEDLNAMMGTRYVNVVGILGDPESGKTACLASLYLLVSHSILKGWSFADSKSLSAFEQIARGARDWNNGTPPEQMTVHTELADDYEPGFLHLRLVRRSDGRRIDLALPDIPGEWTQALVNSARSDRLDFLKSAETIWIVLDGRSLENIEKRHGLIARVGQLAGRLNTMLDGRMPRLMAVVTYRDLHVLDDKVAQRLETEIARRGGTVEIVNVAPFSDDPENIQPGFGLAQLIDSTVGSPPKRPEFWRRTKPTETDRTYLDYRRDR